MKVTIDYCVECNHLDKASETAHQLLEKFHGELESVELVPGDGGVFRVSIDSEIVFDLEDGAYSIPEINKRVEAKLEEEGE